MLVSQSTVVPDGVIDPLPDWPAGEFAADLAQALRREVLAVVTDAAGHIVHVNDELAALLGRNRSELEGRLWYEVAVVRRDRAAVQRMFGGAEGAGHHVEAGLRDAAGTLRTIAWAAHHTADDTGRILAVTTVGIEVGAPQLVMHSSAGGSDPLTGVADRETFMRELEAQVADAGRAGHPLALILVNIDRFRSITETLGLETGDVLLREVATRVQRCAGQRMVARISGDEFAVILPRVRTSGDAVAVAECIVASMRTPCTSLVSPVHLGASAGIALSPHDADEATTLLRHASVALRRAKDAGGDGFSLYVQELGDRAKDRMVLEQQLHGAVSRKEIAVFYQPLIEATSKRIVGVEALARWFHPVLGEISPVRFIPVAEETGMIRSLGLHVMRTALEDLAAWMDAGLGSLTVAVNVSARQLIQPGLVEDILTILDETKVPPELLEIEVTETAVLVDAEVAAQTLRSLAALGISISLDDFGTGYSCIARLNDLSVTTIKIDRSFISATTTVPDSGAFVRALVALARSLDLRVIAEGVETPEQLARLEAEGCDVYQGFLFARPMPEADLRQLLHSAPTLSPG